MAEESRDYPARIWAGHLGGGRRIWKPELADQAEKDFSCEYVRGDVADELVRALDKWAQQYRGWSDAELAKRADPKTFNLYKQTEAALAHARGETPDDR